MKKLASMVLIFFFAFMAAALLSCKSPEIKAEPPVKIELDWKNDEWTTVLVEGLKEQLPKLDKAAVDMRRFCPKYATLTPDQRVIAWAHLAVGIARYETTGYNPLSSMKESNGKYSTGLFQLTYGDSFCPKTKKDGLLTTPSVNIKCAVKLMGNLVEKDALVAAGGYVKYGAKSPKGLAKYWAVVRTPDSKRKHRLADIIAIAGKAPGCI